MLVIAFSILASLSTLALDFVNQRMPNNDYSYYGQDFYRLLPKGIKKEILTQILSSSHGATPGKYDTINVNCTTNCYQQNSLSYDEARRILFGKLFTQRDTKGTYVVDVYCKKKFYFRDVQEVMRMNERVNTEHTWPQSKFSRQYSKDAQKSDLHHLYPSDSEANSRRGNYNFGHVADIDDVLNVNDCDASHLSDRSGTIFQPPTDHRGNVARSLFYFATRYDLKIGPQEEQTLRKWHKEDPVDSAEQERHQAIAEIQKIRNPYIDHPELVEKISDF